MTDHLFFLSVRLLLNTHRADTLLPYTKLFRSRCSAPASRAGSRPTIPPKRRCTSCRRPITTSVWPANKAALPLPVIPAKAGTQGGATQHWIRSEEHTSELQSLMRISYAVFCLKQKNNILQKHKYTTQNKK